MSYSGKVKKSLGFGQIQFSLATRSASTLIKDSHMQIKTFLFDLGNVLMNFSHERMCRQIGELFGVGESDIRKVLFESGYALSFERGEVSEQDLQRHLERKLNRTCELAALQRAAGDIFEPNLEMRILLNQLQQQRYRLVLLSNTCSTHINWIRSNDDVLAFFDECILSYEVGACKPEQAIYDLVLRKIECLPGECFYTDDLPEYVRTAQALGIQATVFKSAQQLANELLRLGVALSLPEEKFQSEFSQT